MWLWHFGDAPGTVPSPGMAVTLLPTPGKSGTEIWARLPALHGSWRSPCYPVLDVVEKTLRHEWVLVQVDQVGRLRETNKESPRCTPSSQALRDAPVGGENSTAPQTALCSPALCSSATTRPGRHFSRGLQRTQQPV